MKIYMDLVFFINFFIDFILLFGTKRVLKEVVSLKRIVLGSLFGSVSILLLFIPLNNITLTIFKFIISIFLILITFGRRNFVKNILYFYLLSVILGGVLYLFDCSIMFDNSGLIFLNNGLSLNIIAIIILSPFIIYLYVRENIKYKNIYSNIYDVSIYYNDKLYKLSGMIDTGNNLVDPYKRRYVILVNRKFNVKKEKLIYVPFKALNSSGLVKCFKPDRVIVGDKLFNNCLVGVSDTKFELNGVDAILPNKFKEDL